MPFRTEYSDCFLFPMSRLRGLGHEALPRCEGSDDGVPGLVHGDEALESPRASPGERE